MSRPDSSKHDTFRLGSLTNAIIATQRPMARAAGDKNTRFHSTDEKKQTKKKQHELKQRMCLHSPPPHEHKQRVKACWRTVHEQPVARQHPDENQHDRERKRQQLRQREAATAAEWDPGDKRDTLNTLSSFSHPGKRIRTLSSINAQEDHSSKSKQKRF